MSRVVGRVKNSSRLLLPADVSEHHAWRALARQAAQKSAGQSGRSWAGTR